MTPAQLIADLSRTGSAVYLYGDYATSYPVARMGITEGGRLWYQQGTAAHLGGQATDYRKDGCMHVWRTKDGRELAFVRPEDADTWELGDIINALGTDRQAITEAELVEML